MKYIAAAALLLCLYSTIICASDREEDANMQRSIKCFRKLVVCKGIVCPLGTVYQPPGKCSCATCISINLGDACSQPKVRGRCRAYFRRYYFNKKSGQCEQFIYGGCGGNANNFRTLQQCQQKCEVL